MGAKKPPGGGFQIREKPRSRRARFLNYFDAAEAAATAAVAAVIAPVAADEAASATDEAAAAVEDAASATEEAAAATDEAAAEAASAAGAVVVSAGLLQAARAATATREANRSDLFMKFLEENFGFEPLPVIRTPALTAGTLSKDSRPSSSVSCA